MFALWYVCKLFEINQESYEFSSESFNYMSELIITSLGEIFQVLSYHTSCDISLWQSCINSGCVYLCDISEKQIPAQQEPKLGLILL